ncbi:MAG: hypothetical protein WAV41_01380 [Microgenomates group bacterium]
MTEIPRHWRLKKQRYGLVGDICQVAICRKQSFPPNGPKEKPCPNCGVFETVTPDGFPISSLGTDYIGLVKARQGIPVDIGMRVREAVDQEN